MTRMNGARFGRTGLGRGRLFIGLGAFVLTVGFVFVKLQLDEARKMEVRCEYEQEILNSELGELQNKLNVKRHQYEQLKYNMELQSKESNTKLTTLQQHYKLLKNQYDDFKEEYTKDKAEKIDKLNTLQSKLEICKEMDKNYEWKAKYLKLLSKKTENEGSSQSPKHFDNINHDWRPTSESMKELKRESPSKEPLVERNFNAQIALNDKLYSIPIEYYNNTKINDDDDNVVVVKKTTNSTLKTSESSMNNLFASPNMSPFNYSTFGLNNQMSSNEKSIQNQRKYVKFPNGVVPFEQNLDEPAIQSSEKVEGNQKMKNMLQQKIVDDLKKLQKENGEDIGAREENDSNYFYNDHILGALSHINDLVANNDNKPQIMNKLNGMDIPNVNDEELQVINGNKLKNEVNQDDGKAYYNFQVEDEDDDEYTDHRQHQQGKAIRERR